MAATRRKRIEGSTFIARNLQWLMRQEQLTQQALSEATGVGQPTINRILTGRNVHPRDSTLHPLAKHFDVAMDDLRLKDFSQNHSGLLSTLRGIKIPMVSSKIAGKQKIGSDWPDRITVYRKVSPDVFAMDVSDEGMEPRIRKGDRVIVEPRMIPRPGSFVAALVNEGESAIVRQYKALDGEGKTKPNYELHAENKFFPRYSNLTAHIKLLGVCVERHEDLEE